MARKDGAENANPKNDHDSPELVDRKMPCMVEMIIAPCGSNAMEATEKESTPVRCQLLIESLNLKTPESHEPDDWRRVPAERGPSKSLICGPAYTQIGAKHK